MNSHFFSPSQPQNDIRPQREPGFLGILFGWLSGLARFLISTALFFVMIAGVELEAPNVTAHSIPDALKILKKDGLTLSLDREEPHVVVPEGDVISQFPAPGIRIKAGSTVRVVISSGPPLLTVPDLRGEPRVAAESRLRNLGLTIGNVATVPTVDGRGGIVITTDPPGNSGVIQGAKVNLLVSSGRIDTVKTMPNLYGLTIDEARTLLASYGLILAEERKVPAPGVLAGLIHDQAPAPGVKVNDSTRVSVSYNPEADPTTPQVDPGMLGAPPADDAAPTSRTRSFYYSTSLATHCCPRRIKNRSSARKTPPTGLSRGGVGFYIFGAAAAFAPPGSVDIFPGAFQGLAANVAPVVHTFETDLAHQFIGPLDRHAQVGVLDRHAQHTAAVGNDVARGVPARPGVIASRPLITLPFS